MLRIYPAVLFILFSFVGPFSAFSQLERWRPACVTGKDVGMCGMMYVDIREYVRLHPSSDDDKRMQQATCIRDIAKEWGVYNKCLKGADTSSCTAPTGLEEKVGICESISDGISLALQADAGHRAAALGPSVINPVITGIGAYDGPPGFDRGMQTTQYCGNDPESWVRGSVHFDKSNGRADITIQLETDAVHSGPKGKLDITLQQFAGVDAATHVIATKSIYSIHTDEVGIGGKKPGSASIVTRDASVDVPMEIAPKVNFVKIEAKCTGFTDSWFGWLTTQEIKDAFKAAGEAAASQ